MILVACDLYIRIKDEKILPQIVNFTMLASFLSHFELESSLLFFFDLERPLNSLSWSSSSSFPPKFLSFVLQRISLAFEPKLRITNFHYTEFAVWCAKRVSDEVRLVSISETTFTYLTSNKTSHLIPYQLNQKK